jgi:von Willebrand factor type A domain
MTTAQPGFSLTVSQNKYLSDRDREMHVIVRVRACGVEDRAADRAGPQLAEVFIIDCSGSMANPPTKLAAAKRATAAAIDLLPDGVFFAVVVGTHQATTLYPADAGMAAAGPQTRAEAGKAVSGLYAHGGTAIGSWLGHGRQLLDGHPTAVRHAILLTDGHNEHESPDELARTLSKCAGHFVCDARGIGDDWDADQLLRITSVLRGAASAILTDSDLVAEFRAVTQAAMRKVIADVRLRVTCTPTTRLRFIKQVYPTEADLVDDGATITHPAAEFATGSWGDDSRDYHLCFDLDPADGRPAEDLRIARVDLLVDGQRRVDPVPVLVRWTDDPTASTRVDADVAHYTAQEEFSRAVAAGCDAYNGSDRVVAAAEWGRAVRLAKAADNMKALAQMERLVDIVDPVAGVVRVRDDLRRRDVNAVWLDSTHTESAGPAASARVAGSPPVAPPSTGPAWVCVCGRASPAEAAFCNHCGRRPENDVRPGPAVAG